MGKRKEKLDSTKRSSQTLPSSPSHSFSSSSSSDFEFTISLSPRKSSTALCPADELFYKGQILPLHLSPRISMVRNLLLASSSTSSSSDTTTTASRDSTGSSNDSTSSFTSDLALLADSSCDSSRPSSVTEDDESFKRLHFHNHLMSSNNSQIKKGSSSSSKYFSLSRFSSVFKKEAKSNQEADTNVSSVKRMSTTAKEVIRKYLKKVKPLYEKLSTTQKAQQQKMPPAVPLMSKTESMSTKHARKDSNGGFSHSFSGNLRYPRRRNCVSSCPSSMRSSPSHSGVLTKNGFNTNSSSTSRIPMGSTGGMCRGDTSSMEELQSAIQGAIAHCKNSMMQNKAMISNEI